MWSEIEIESLSLYKRMLFPEDLAEQTHIQRFYLMQTATDDTENMFLSMVLESTGMDVTSHRWMIELINEMPKAQGNEWVCEPIGHHINEYLPLEIRKLVNKRLEECESRGIHLQHFIFALKIRGENSFVVITNYEQWKQIRAMVRSGKITTILDPILLAHRIIREEGCRKEGIRVIVARWCAI